MKNSLAVSVACMAIYWPIPGFKGRTFKLCVLTRWDFNFCVRCSPLRGMPAKIVDRSYSPHKIHSSCQCWRTTYGENYTLNVFSCSCFSLSQFEQWPLYFERPFIVIFWLCTQETFTVRQTWAETLFFFLRFSTAHSLSSCIGPRREARDVWCLPPVWNLRAVIWFHFAISSLVLLLSPVALSVLSFFSASY